MGEAPHEVYTDTEKKARAEKVCGNCEHWRQYFKDETLGDCGSPFLDTRSEKATIKVVNHSFPITTTKDFGCIHFEPKT